MSVSSSHNYETIYVLKPNVGEGVLSTLNQKIDNVVAKFEGKLGGRDDWGNRELAYPIDHNTNGRYCVIHYTGNKGVVEEIERHFKILDEVIRFITVAVPADYNYENVKKQIHTVEEEYKKNRELRKKGNDFAPRERDRDR